MPQSPDALTMRTIELEQARPLADLGLPTRALNSLLRHGIVTVGQLIARSSADLIREVHGFGAGSLREIEDALALQGLSLAVETSTFRYMQPLSRNVRNHNAWQRPVTGATSQHVTLITELPIPRYRA